MLRTFTREKRAEYERGRQEGWQEGQQEGRQEGWQAGQQAGIYAVAQRMSAAGFALEEIVQATGLAPEVIQSLPPLGDENGHDLISSR